MNGELISRDNVLKRLSVFKLNHFVRKKDREANQHFMNGVKSAIEVIVSEPAVTSDKKGVVVRVKKKAKERRGETDEFAALVKLIYKAYIMAYEMANGKDHGDLITSVRDLLWIADMDACYLSLNRNDSANSD